MFKGGVDRRHRSIPRVLVCYPSRRMSRTGVDARERSAQAAITACTVLTTACAMVGPSGTISPPAPESIGALSGTVSIAEGQPSDSEMGPMVVLLEPIEGAGAPARPTQQFRISSSTDRFDPAFTTVAEGDFIVFANGGAVSHRFFSASLGPDLQIPVGAASSSAPLRMEKTGELRFFCSLHPDETFSVLVTRGAFSAVVDPDGRFYVAPIPEGSYRLSVWSRQAQRSIRTVQVDGPSVTETIRLDPSPISR